MPNIGWKSIDEIFLSTIYLVLINLISLELSKKHIIQMWVSKFSLFRLFSLPVK